MSVANTAARIAPATRDKKTRVLFRLGYAAHGLVYLLIGALAVDAALGSGGEQAQGSRGVIAELGSGTWGTVLLTVLAIGLLGYAWMRFWQGLANPARHGNDAKGIGTRIGRVASGLAQTALAFYALSIAYGWFSTSGGGGEQTASGGDSGAADLTAKIMSVEGGRWIVGILGAGICIAGLAQLGKAAKASFLRELSITTEQRKWVKPLGRLGFAARFVVFTIAGGFVIAAAWQADPDEARGLGGALRTLQDQPWGPWLLAAVGAGLVAFAVIRGVYARYAVLPDQQAAR